MIIWYFLF